MVIVQWVRHYEHIERGTFRYERSKWHATYWGYEGDDYTCCDTEIDYVPPPNRNAVWEFQHIEIWYSDGEPDCKNCLRRLEAGW
jgi:hypothetical protein